MPGFTTHYLFGLDTYKSLENNNCIKRIIFDNHAPFSLGLQGPDIFFYFLPSYLMSRQNPGSLVHISNTNTFLKYLLKSIKFFSDSADTNIAKSYVMGFLGHYILDSNCHPYIYSKSHFVERTSKYYGDHINLEVDIDSEMLDYFKHKLPSAFRQDTTIFLTKQQLHVITLALYYSFKMTFPDFNMTYGTIKNAVKSMQIGTRLLRDPHGKKKVLLRKIEGCIWGYPILSPMIPSNRIRFYPDPLNVLHKKWNNPWNIKDVSTKSFFELFKDSEDDYRNVLNATYQYYEGNDETLNEVLYLLGNKSYHSGLDCSIPS